MANVSINQMSVQQYVEDFLTKTSAERLLHRGLQQIGHEVDILLHGELRRRLNRMRRLKVPRGIYMVEVRKMILAMDFLKRRLVSCLRDGDLPLNFGRRAHRRRPDSLPIVDRLSVGDADRRRLIWLSRMISPMVEDHHQDDGGGQEPQVYEEQLDHHQLDPFSLVRLCALGGGTDAHLSLLITRGWVAPLCDLLKIENKEIVLMSMSVLERMIHLNEAEVYRSIEDAQGWDTIYGLCSNGDNDICRPASGLMEIYRNRDRYGRMVSELSNVLGSVGVKGFVV